MMAGRSGTYSFDENSDAHLPAVHKSIDIEDVPKKCSTKETDEVDYAKDVEPAVERRQRYFSLAIITLTAFTFNLSFSIILTSAKPYLDQMDPEAGTQFLGLFISAQPLAQLFFSPLLGFLGNKFGSIRILSILSTLVLTAGFVLYACVSALPGPRRWYLFAARFLIGAAAGSITLCFSYIASATTVKERTTAISLFSLAGSTAFVFGPVIQLAFAPLGVGTDVPIGGDLFINLFTGPSWLSAGMALFNAFVFMPGIFSEHNVAKKEGDFVATMAAKKRSGKATCPSPGEMAQQIKKQKRPDKWALIVCIVIFASVQFNFIFLESVATLLVIEQLGMSEKSAIIMVGLGFAGAGVYSGLIFAILGPLARRMGERILLIVGVVFLALGPVMLYPCSGPPPPLKYSDVTNASTPLAFNNESLIEQLTFNYGWLSAPIPVSLNNISGGCPIDLQPWCGYTSAIRWQQLIAGFILIVTGFPMGAAMTNAIFSKIIGPFPQGTWMGILGAGACFARVLCPICVTNIYSAYGPMATFAFMTGVMIIVLMLLLINYRHLVPYRYENIEESVPYLIS
ncbi:major facilitator superfamily domain-containing protein 8-like [Daphnia carinata]|uniref:major facilitator superfamily domain-containing protein 8-like n=1 Tax=Daphnia carinata TaxID=120202 RepID=UPI00257AAC44|nr:major facilitator superfamily domain-containing protein 8-like [Daphnia carinata]